MIINMMKEARNSNKNSVHDTNLEIQSKLFPTIMD